MNDTVVRLGLAALIVTAGLAVFWAWNRWQLRRLARGSGTVLLGLEMRPPNTAAVLYFRTPECTVCTTAQRPALDRLAADLGSAIRIIEVDAAAQPAVADYWGVLSVPTTFIIDAAGQPRAINHGLTSKDKLLRQLEGASLPPEALTPAPSAVAAPRWGVSDLEPNPASAAAETEWSARHESYPRTH
jgi:thioredoxin 1